jgi:hypothetical protein
MDRSELLRRAAAKVELEWRRIRASCEYFIRQFVWIENKTAPGGVSRFEIWDGQVRALLLMLTVRMLIVVKARQLGLTWLALAYAVWRMITRAGYTVIAISQTEPDAIELIDFRLATIMLPRLPAWMIRHVPEAPPGWDGLTWEASKHELVIYHPGGVPSRFKAKAQSPNAGRSITADLLLLDEWAKQQWAREIWASAYPTVSAPGTDQQVIGLSTGEKNTLFEEIAVTPAQYGFELVFLPWMTDPRRTPEWFEGQKRALPNSYRSEFPATLDDAFAVGQGAFFPEWIEGHYGYPAWQPPKHWKRYGAYDPGMSRACFKWYALSPAGWARGYREYYPTHTTDTDQAQAILAMSKYPDGTDEVLEYVVADTDAWSASRGTGKSTAEVFMEHGMPMRQADKDLHNGWRRLHEWLQPMDDHPETFAWLTFTPDCAHTIRTYPGCKESKTDPDDIDKSSEHHPQDVDRYFIMSRPAIGQGVAVVPGERPPVRGFDPLREDEARGGDWTES